MFYKYARIYGSDFSFREGAFEVVDGKFAALFPEHIPDDAIDLGGVTVIPGLIDIHSHGNSGADFSDGDYQGLQTMAAYYAKVADFLVCSPDYSKRRVFLAGKEL